MNKQEWTVLTPRESAQLAAQERANNTEAFTQFVFFCIVAAIVFSALIALAARLQRYIAEQRIAVEERQAAIHRASLIHADSNGLLPVDTRLLQGIDPNKLLEAYIIHAGITKYPTMLETLHIHNANSTHTVTQSRTDNDLSVMPNTQPAFNPSLLLGSGQKSGAMNLLTEGETVVQIPAQVERVTNA